MLVVEGGVAGGPSGGGVGSADDVGGAVALTRSADDDEAGSAGDVYGTADAAHLIQQLEGHRSEGGVADGRRGARCVQRETVVLSSTICSNVRRCHSTG